MSAIRLGCLILSLAWSGMARADAADDSYNPDDSGSGGSSGSSGGSSGSSGGSSGSSGGSSGSSGGSSGGDSADAGDDKDCGCASGASSPTTLLSLGAGIVALVLAARRR